MPELGRAALVVCLGLALYALFAGGYAAFRRRRRLAVSAQNALIAAFGAAIVASAVLLSALLRNDFSFTYVADHTSIELPTAYTISAFWGGQEGSLLLWLLVLTGFSAATVAFNRRSGRDLLAWAVPVLGLVAVFFSFMLVAVSRPFATQPLLRTARGSTRASRTVHMMVHPPLLYLGFVGLAVRLRDGCPARSPERRGVDRRDRRWTLAAWTFLGIGQLLGAHWAYVEVGWGGYYAWDPVENAALMPWLAATAFLHSVMIQEKRGMLKVWNVVLVVGAFALALGTFLTVGDRQLDPLVHGELDRGLVPGLHRPRPGGIDLPRALQAAAAAREDTARIARVPRGHVPLQQPAARRPLPDDPVGGRLPDPLRGRARRADHGRRALLQLLPGGLRPSAAAVDGDRAAHRLAARLAALPARASSGPRWPRSSPASSSSRSVQAPRRPVSPRTPLRPSCSARSSTSSCGGHGRGGRSAAVPGCLRSAAWSLATAGATAGTSCTRRSCSWRSASRARARTTPSASRS